MWGLDVDVRGSVNRDSELVGSSWQGAREYMLELKMKFWRKKVNVC